MNLWLPARQLYPQYSWRRGRTGAGGATATWNSADKNARITLSGGDLIATKSNGSSFAMLRATVGASTGKKFCSFVFDTANGQTFGLSLGGSSLADGVWAGSSTSSIGYYPAANGVFFSSSPFQTVSLGANTGHTYDLAVDLTNRLLWGRRNGGNWNNSGTADPATGVGGVDYSAVTQLAGLTLYPTGSMDSSGSGLTANFGASAYTYAAPSGFGNW